MRSNFFSNRTTKKKNTIAYRALEPPLLEWNSKKNNISGVRHRSAILTLTKCVDLSTSVSCHSEERASFVTLGISLFNGQYCCSGSSKRDAELLVPELGEEHSGFLQGVLQSNAVGFVLATGHVRFRIHGNGSGHLQELEIKNMTCTIHVAERTYLGTV